MNKLLISLIMSFFMAAGASAMDLTQAKSEGLVGEGNRGYLDYVVKPPQAEVVTLVKRVNNQRRDKFTASAKRNGITVEQVENRFYERAVTATSSGNYYQAPGGNWVKK